MHVLIWFDFVWVCCCCFVLLSTNCSEALVLGFKLQAQVHHGVDAAHNNDPDDDNDDDDDQNSLVYYCQVVEKEFYDLTLDQVGPSLINKQEPFAQVFANTFLHMCARVFYMCGCNRQRLTEGETAYG